MTLMMEKEDAKIMTGGSWVCSFKPIIDPHAQLIVLGSMPGVRSLSADQYYAHPQNAFWRIMADVLGFEIEASYVERVAALQSAGIALWDVLQACQREGSLASSIMSTTQVVNDFNAIFQDYP